jgi:NADPH:quinone reductase-like Zn-dependent oxidoreductase
VLQYREVPKPEPKNNEILIKIHAATVTAGDCEIRRMQLPMGIGLLLRMFIGLIKPKRRTILGTEFAGEIEAVGKEVKKFKKGEEIFGSTGFVFGTNAEYVCVPEDAVIASKPAGVSFEEAATIPTGGLESLHFLRMSNIQRGQKVLINGAGGSIGTYGIQLAKYMGAEVTAVDSAGKLDLLRNIGADKVLDYAKEDFAQSCEKYDIIFDVVGKSHYSRSLGSLRENGYYLIANPKLSTLVRKRFTSLRGTKKIITKFTTYRIKDLEYIMDLVETGKIKPVTDRRYPLEKVVDAHRYVESGQKKGNVVINII